MRGRARERWRGWAAEPAEDAENPLLAEVDEATGRPTPAGQHYAAVTEAGGPGRGGAPAAGAEQPAPGRRRRGGDRRQRPVASAGRQPALTEAERELVAAWELDTGLLLAERERRSAPRRRPGRGLLPARLSVSALVALASDPDELARQVRRPMPQPPARQARRGTAFHLWLEERFGQQRLIDDDDLFAARTTRDRTTT